MDVPSGYASTPRGRGGSKVRRGATASAGRPRPDLFQDVSQPPSYAPSDAPSSAYVPPAPVPSFGPAATQPFPGAAILSDPMASMAMQYGGSLAGQGREYVEKNLEKYVSTTKIKYYFAVDTTYVGKKLSLLLFPYAHQDWSVPYSPDTPVQPRYEVNAPDLYIPVMGFVTFILTSAIALGVQHRFTPETLGVLASSALGYLLLEILLILLALYVLSISTGIGYLDWTAYCSYKYFGMVLTIVGGLLVGKFGYFLILGWTGLSLAFFLVRALRVQILPHESSELAHGNKRRLYVLLSLAIAQPVFMSWLTFRLV